VISSDILALLKNKKGAFTNHLKCTGMQKKIEMEEKLVVHGERGICVLTALNIFCFVNYCYKIISL